MQWTWKQRLRIWSKMASVPDTDELGKDRPPCWHHLQARYKQLTAEQNKSIHPQSWIHWRCTVKTQTEHGTNEPPEWIDKGVKESEEIHTDSGSGIWEWPRSTYQYGYAGKLDGWNNLQGLNWPGNPSTRFQEKTQQCVVHLQREDVQAIKTVRTSLING